MDNFKDPESFSQALLGSPLHIQPLLSTQQLWSQLPLKSLLFHQAWQPLGTDAQIAGMEGAKNSSCYGCGRLGCIFFFFKETGKHKEVNTCVISLTLQKSSPVPLSLEVPPVWSNLRDHRVSTKIRKQRLPAQPLKILSSIIIRIESSYTHRMKLINGITDFGNWHVLQEEISHSYH